jgi:hypothetical protein
VDSKRISQYDANQNVQELLSRNPDEILLQTNPQVDGSIGSKVTLDIVRVGKVQRGDTNTIPIQ